MFKVLVEAVKEKDKEMQWHRKRAPAPEPKKALSPFSNRVSFLASASFLPFSLGWVGIYRILVVGWTVIQQRAGFSN